jgi:hypothetical protein
MVTMKNAIFWDVTPCGSCQKQCFGESYRFYCQGDKNLFLCSMLQLLVTANLVPSLPILITLMMEAIHPSKTLVLTRTTCCNTP